MTAPVISAQAAAAVIARFLQRRGVRRVYGLCGGHIMPVWMQLDAAGIRIVDVRDERAAVYMAHAEAELGGGLGVALVTAGPGVTNAMTGIANAHVARASRSSSSANSACRLSRSGRRRCCVHRLYRRTPPDAALPASPPAKATRRSGWRAGIARRRPN